MQPDPEYPKIPTPKFRSVQVVGFSEFCQYTVCYKFVGRSSHNSTRYKTATSRSNSIVVPTKPALVAIKCQLIFFHYFIYTIIILIIAHSRNCHGWLYDCLSMQHNIQDFCIEIEFQKS